MRRSRGIHYIQDEEGERKKFIIVSILLLGLFVGLYLVQKQQLIKKRARVTGVDLSLVPSKTTVAPGEEFSVDIFINTNEFTVSATELHVTYDSTYLEGLSITESDFLPVVLPPGPQVINGGASIILGSLPAEPKQGSGVLATLNLKAKQASENPVEIMFAAGTQTAAIGEVDDVTKSLTPTSVVVGGANVPQFRLVTNYETHSVGKIMPVFLKFSMGNMKDKKISAVTARITYPYSGSSPAFDVVESSDRAAPVDSIDVRAPSEGWEFPVNSVTRSNGKVTIDLAAVNTTTTGFIADKEVTLATIYFKANRMPTPNPVVVSFDMNESKILTKDDPTKNVLAKADNSSFVFGEKTTFTFNFRLQGVENEAGGICNSYSGQATLKSQRMEREFDIGAGSKQGVVNLDWPIDLTDLLVAAEGESFTVFVKLNGYLRKKLGDVTIKPGINEAPQDWSNIVAKVGDFDSQDTPGWNMLDISDIGEILSVYKALQVPVSDTNRKYNVDCNGIIDIKDIALVLTNYTALQVFGD